jgi:G3E family GTPase
VIEASGVADPSRIGHYARSLARLHLDAIIVTADADGIRRQARDKYVGDIVLQQLAAADMLVLTKTDLLAPETVQEVRQWLETQAPDVPAGGRQRRAAARRRAGQGHLLPGRRPRRAGDFTGGRQAARMADRRPGGTLAPIRASS